MHKTAKGKNILCFFPQCQNENLKTVSNNADESLLMKIAHGFPKDK